MVKCIGGIILKFGNQFKLILLVNRVDIFVQRIMTGISNALKFDFLYKSLLVESFWKFEICPDSLGIPTE